MNCEDYRAYLEAGEEEIKTSILREVENYKCRIFTYKTPYCVNKVYDAYLVDRDDMGIVCTKLKVIAVGDNQYEFYDENQGNDDDEDYEISFSAYDAYEYLIKTGVLLPNGDIHPAYKNILKLKK